MTNSDLSNASSEDLFELAQSRPDLWALLLEHPSMYPGLAEWIRAQMPAPELPSVPLPPPDFEEASVEEPPIQLPATAEVAVEGVAASPKNRLLAGAIAAGVALVLIIGGAVFWFLRSDVTAGALETIPKSADVATFENLGGNAALLPVGAGGELYLTNGDEKVALINQGGQNQLVAVTNGDEDSDPAWTELVDSGPCTVEGGIVDCGMGVSANLGASSPAMPMSYSTLVPGSALDDFPYYVDAGTLYANDGTAIEVAFDEFTWALPGEDNTWVVGGAHWVLALDGSEILWSYAPTDEDALINAFHTDQPSWATSGDVVLYVAGGALNAQQISTGKVLWKVDVPLTSYQVARDTILVSMGDALALLPLNGVADDPGVSRVVAAGGEESPDPEPEPAAPVIDPEDILNGTIEVSEQCAGRVTGDETAQTFAFIDGLATDIGPAGSQIRIVDVSLVNNDGAPYALVWFSCEPPDRSPSMEVAVYDQSLSLAQSLFTWNAVTAKVSNETEITSFNTSDNQVTVDSGPWLGYGDTFCMSCTGGYHATVDYEWSGGSYYVIQVNYETPYGTVAEPSISTLNHIYGQVADGAESTVMQYFTGDATEVVKRLDTDGIGDQEIRWFFRELYFAPSGIIQGCTLIPPEGTVPYFPTAETSLELFHFAPSIQPGDFVCLVNVNGAFATNSPNAHVWWLVRPTPSPEDFKIYEIGRDFS